MKESLYDDIEMELEEDEGSWAISYADMITVLLGFFVIFFSFNFKEVQKKKEMGVIAQVFSFSDGIQSSDSQKRDLNPSQNYVNISSFSSVVRIENSEEAMVYFPGVSFFDSGQTTLNAQGKNVLTTFIQRFEKLEGDYSVEVYAYTDDQPVIARDHNWRKYEDNTELSALRAVSVFKFFKSNGISKDDVNISGGGVINEDFLSKILPKDKKSKKIDRAYLRTIGLKIKRES